MKKTFSLFIFFTVSIIVFSQKDDGRGHIDSVYAAKLLEAAINGSERHNLIHDGRVLIESEKRAIELAEFYLFEIYGKMNIIKQRPYDIFHIDHRWIISGTKEIGPGGTFLIIIDDITGYVLQITHGK